MIDLHSHLLPGIDDGSRSLEESVEMCRLAAADGVEVMVATPHLRHPRYWNDDKSQLERLWHELIEHPDLELEVLLGGEITIGSESLEEIDRLPGGELLTLCSGRYLLLELDWQGVGPDPLEMVHELTIMGWRPIIAHPERVAWLARDLGLVGDLVEQGALMQVTAMSVTGAFGSLARERAEAFLDTGLAHFLASDAHDLDHRPPGLAAARELVAERCGEAYADALTVENPRAVIEDRPLPPMPETRRTESLGSRLRRLASRS